MAAKRFTYCMFDVDADQPGIRSRREFWEKGGYGGSGLCHFICYDHQQQQHRERKRGGGSCVQRFILFISDLLLNITWGILMGTEVTVMIQLSK